MRRMFLPKSATLLLLLAGCGGPPPQLLPTESVTASFPARGLVDVIVIDAVNRLPLRAAVLVAPDGTTTPGAVEVNPRPGYAGGQRIGLDAGSAAVEAVGSPAAAATARDLTAPTVQSQAHLDIMISRATIAVEDPAAYRKDWAHYKIRLDYGRSPTTGESQEIAAPAPQPQA